jgi:hypothetical protein
MENYPEKLGRGAQMYPDPMVPLLEKVRAYEKAIAEIKAAYELYDYDSVHDIMNIVDKLEHKLANPGGAS